MLAGSRFRDRVLETEYRQVHFEGDRRQIAAVVVVMTLISALFSVTDARLWAGQGELATLWAARGVHAAVSAALLAFLYGTRNHLHMDRAGLGWLLLSAALLFYVNSTRPSDYVGNFMLDVIFPIVVFSFFPLRFSYQVASAGTLLTATVASLVLYRSLDPMLERVVAGACFVVASLGAYGAHRLHRSTRLQYGTYRHERQLSQSLTQALAEVRTLRGILPICAQCHKIRDEAGLWNRLEAYVSEHTEADFSHGLCPSCAETLYPELRSIRGGCGCEEDEAAAPQEALRTIPTSTTRS